MSDHIEQTKIRIQCLELAIREAKLLEKEEDVHYTGLDDRFSGNYFKRINAHTRCILELADMYYEWIWVDPPEEEEEEEII